jgi:D-sedoheptulose 7-phosphate isomerase
MSTATAHDLSMRVAASLDARNRLCATFFAREAGRLAEACREMADRFGRGGRLLAFGQGARATDAQHVAVEFIHPVIVGKRALPALDLSIGFARWVDAILSPQDMVMGFGPPAGDPDVWRVLEAARARGAMTFALPAPASGSGSRLASQSGPGPEAGASYAVDAPTGDAFVHQEIIEMLYHTLWETVHVFFEHRSMGRDVGAAGFLYPFLGQEPPQPASVLADVAASIQMKVQDDARLREQVACEQADAIVQAALAMRERLTRGGKLLIFGNGGSATDANDWALDCVDPPHGFRQVPAISLALEPAAVTAIANDVGADVIFLRQLIAQAGPDDVAVAISTSGGSRNIIMALDEARKRGLLTVALLGYDGGEIARRGLADVAVIVRSDYIPRIQEVQASIYHIIRELLEVLDHD